MIEKRPFNNGKINNWSDFTGMLVDVYVSQIEHPDARPFYRHETVIAAYASHIQRYA